VLFYWTKVKNCGDLYLMVAIPMSMEHPKQQARALQLALTSLFQISGWLVGPLVVALFVGRWLDGHFGTKPWLFLISTGVAFVFTAIGIIKETKIIARRVDRLDQTDSTKK
jgi:F0F1-type ATP synthase assembly protein I